MDIVQDFWERHREDPDLVEDQEEVDMFMAYFEKTWIGKVSVSTCLSFISLHFYIKGTISKDYFANLYATAISYFC